MRTQLLIFDLDGTLVDSRADLAAGINHMRRHFSLPELPVPRIAGYIGDGVRSLVQRSLQGADVDFEEALKVNQEYYLSHLTVHTSTYPGVINGIRELADAGHQLALLSNKPGISSRAIMQHFALTGYFSLMIGGGDVEKLKPEPDGIYKIMADSGLDAEQTWMIGDHHTDLVVAQNAGIKSVYVEYGFGDKLDHEADISFASFSDLVRYFV